MRKHICKAKRTDNGLWLFGWITRQYRKHHRGKLLTTMQGRFFGQGEHQVDTDTICRPTGLIDLKGNDIYEYDIIELPEGASDEFPRGYIFWDEDKCRFAVRMGYIDGPPWTIQSMDDYNWEVIGNIFDNRDLLEEPDFDLIFDFVFADYEFDEEEQE